MPNIFYPACIKGCANAKQDNCFITINDISDEKLTFLATRDPTNSTDPTVKEQLTSISNELRDLNVNNNLFSYPQFFNPRKLYIPVKGAVKVISENTQQIVSTYVDNYWKNYEDNWNYQEGVTVVSYGTGLLLLTLWSNVNIQETYNVQIKRIENLSFQENVDLDSVLFVFPDLTVQNAYPYYLINSVPQNFVSVLQYSSTPININTSHTVFLVKLTPKL